MYRLIILIIIIPFVFGCAFRNQHPVQLDKFEPYFDLYSRNFLVAAPTASAKVLCGVAGGTALAVFVPSGEAFLAGAYLSGNACGAIVGLPFIALSYLCNENPWYIDESHEFKLNWSCQLSSTYFP